jgi:hypothetical protein
VRQTCGAIDRCAYARSARVSVSIDSRMSISIAAWKTLEEHDVIGNEEGEEE